MLRCDMTSELMRRLQLYPPTYIKLNLITLEAGIFISLQMAAQNMQTLNE